jgi:hypothetical protein
VLLAIALFSGVSLAQIQTKIQGTTKVQGSAAIGSPFSRNVQIMALFPPAIGSTDYSSFYSNVMTQPSVDGVTVEIDWSKVETSAATSPPCAAPDDTHQTDSVGQCHTYDWTPYESTMTAPGIWTWFVPFTVGGVSTPKKVNLLLFGIGTGNKIDSITPWYVTSSSYVTNFAVPYNRQDVLNGIKDCPTVPWAGVAPNPSITFTRAGTTVTVFSSGCCNQNATTIHDQDTVYVASPSNSNYATATGKTATWVSNDSFSYQVANSGPLTCTDCTYISQGWSSPVPYEQAYTAAWKPFIAAASLHFGPSYTANGVTVGSAGTNQLGYVRAGTWTGAESFVYCISGGSSGGLSMLASPYTYAGSSTWLTDYQNKVQYIQSLDPTMRRFWSINEVSSDVTYPNTEAQYATAAANVYGFVNGFGSQGLSLLDDTSSACVSGTSASNWCQLFGQYHATGMPLELQQIAISDPTNVTCATGCGVPPGVAGDLRQWLPYAVSNYVTVVEMYYRDLGLAFDVGYCTMVTGGACTKGYTPQSNSNITTTQEWQWFSAGNGGTLTVGVGQGSNCPLPPGGIGAGDCSYASAINAAHGPH